MAFEVEFKDENLNAMLKDLAKRVDDFKQMRKGFVGLTSAIVFQDIMDHFSREQGSESKWQKWSDAYNIAMGKRGRGGNKILQDSGALRQNFKPTSYRIGAEGITWYNNAKTKAGAPYAYYHDEGVGRNPKRDFMWLSSKALSKLEEQLVMYLLESEK